MIWSYLLESDLLIEFGIRIKQLRKQAGLSQQDLADHIGTTRSRISEIEKGKNTSIIFLFRILKVFNKMSEFETILTPSTISPKQLFNSKKSK